MREKAAKLFFETQSKVCSALESLDGSARFETDEWKRPDSRGANGGGGVTRVIRRGKLFEKGGVNFSQVQGLLTAEMSEKLGGVREEQEFFATGVSLVIHPFSPLVPTTHANYRYLEVGKKRWFGGGMDLTPYYLFEDDASHFHGILKETCNTHDEALYPRLKKWCDEYFYLPHRSEARGIGGIFFDYIGRDEPVDYEKYFELVAKLCGAILRCYVPIVERRMSMPWTSIQKEFQLIRRGRYVEFNLLYDRGTQFGLNTGGRTESILMSLPPEVRWEYNFAPKPGSEEEKFLQVVRNPRAWV